MTMARQTTDRISSSAGRPRLSREQALGRVIAHLEHQERTTLDRSEMLAAAGVSPRTLRTMFLDVFGMTPGRYLRLRRMHQLRIALLMADPALRTVAGLCAHFRLTDAGRAAREYRQLFGEFPSQTLSRRPGEASRPVR